MMMGSKKKKLAIDHVSMYRSYGYRQTMKPIAGVAGKGKDNWPHTACNVKAPKHIGVSS